jgi:signal transduction histidine kinase
MRFLSRWLFIIMLGSPMMAEDLDSSAWVGDWIWAETIRDRQECHFMRVVDVPAGTRVESALLRMTADNFYRVYLDGHLIGQGSDWRLLTEYDITRLLMPGRHVLAVSVVNDYEFAGLLAGLRILLSNGRKIEIPTNENWRLVPDNSPSWPFPKLDKTLTNVRVVRHFETWMHPRVYKVPVSLPEMTSFWQQRWFQVSLMVASAAGLLGVLALSGMLLLKRQSERVVRRERARIANDLHDNLGGGLTQLVLLGEAVRRELGEAADPSSGEKLKRLCEQARLMGRNMKETVWLINSQRDTVSELASYLARYAETFFRDAPIRCRFAIDDDLPESPCGLGVRRNLLLGVKEAFNNALRHSGATKVELIVELRRGVLRIVVRDNGTGFDAKTISPGDGLRNLELRAREAGGQFVLRSSPGDGTAVEFLIPLAKPTHWGG